MLLLSLDFFFFFRAVRQNSQVSTQESFECAHLISFDIFCDRNIFIYLCISDDFVFSAFSQIPVAGCAFHTSALSDVLLAPT